MWRRERPVSTRFSAKWNNLGERVPPRSFFKEARLILTRLLFLIEQISLTSRWKSSFLVESTHQNDLEISN